jgi:hypothetical protein
MGRRVQSKTQRKDAKLEILRSLAKEKKLSVTMGGAFSTPLTPLVEDDKKRADLTKVGLVVSFDTAAVCLRRVQVKGFPKATVGDANSKTRTAAKEQRLLKDIMVNG